MAPDKPRAALPDVSIETDRGPAQLMCGGRFLKWLDTYYVVEHSPQLSTALTTRIWRSRPGNGGGPGGSGESAVTPASVSG